MATTPTTDKLLTKIQALLNKAGDKGVSTEESQAFFAKAQELLTKHGLEMTDLDAIASKEDQATFDIQDEKVQTGRKKHEADDYIWPILKECFGVNVLYSTYSAGGSIKHAWILVGDEFQVSVAKLAAGLIYKTMTQGVRKFIKDNHLRKTAEVKRSYFRGVKDGYLRESEQAREMMMAQATPAQREAYGLVLVGKGEAIKAHTLAKFNPRTRKSQIRSGHDDGAYTKGKERGRAMDLNFRNKIS